MKRIMVTTGFRLVKLVCWIYIAGFALVALHIPRTVFEMGIKDKQPIVLLTPLFAPAIVRAYAQFAASLTWPYSSPGDFIRLSNLLRTRGYDDRIWGRRLIFDEAPILVKNRPNSILVTNERYQSAASILGFPTGKSGIVLHIGDYFCLTDLDPTRKSQCYTILSGRHGNYLWQELGETEGQPAHIQAS